MKGSALNATPVSATAKSIDCDMAAKDIYHSAVKNALEKDSWTITDDSLTLSLGLRSLYVDLGAEKVVAAMKNDRRIAVEVKSFVGHSTIAELEKAIGQYMLYDEALLESETDSDRQLFLAIPEDIVEELADDRILTILIKRFRINILVYNPVKQVIAQWIQPATAN